MTQTSWSPRDLDILRQDIDQLFERVRKTQKGEEDLAPLRQKINQLLGSETLSDFIDAKG